MTSRLLDPREWQDKLVGTELESVWPVLPATARVIVVEDDGEIVGCWALFQMTHCEGCWIAPRHRGKGSVAVRLLDAMRATAVEMGARAVATAATTDDVAGMLRKLGAVELPGRHFSLRVT